MTFLRFTRLAAAVAALGIAVVAAFAELELTVAALGLLYARLSRAQALPAVFDARALVVAAAYGVAVVAHLCAEHLAVATHR